MRPKRSSPSLFNVLVIGKKGAGKTSLLNSLVGDRAQLYASKSTTSYAWFNCEYQIEGGEKKRMQFVDTFSIKTLTVRDQFHIHEAQVIMLVYDGTRPTARKDILDTLNYIKMIKDDIAVLIVGAKCDNEDFIDCEEISSSMKVKIIACSAHLSIGLREIGRLIISNNLPSLKTVLKHLNSQAKPEHQRSLTWKPTFMSRTPRAAAITGRQAIHKSISEPMTHISPLPLLQPGTEKPRSTSIIPMQFDTGFNKVQSKERDWSRYGVTGDPRASIFKCINRLTDAASSLIHNITDYIG